jgi:hypothetical protein
MNTHYSLAGDDMLTKKDALVIKMKEIIDEKYADGRTTIMGDLELEEIAHELSGGKFSYID